MPPEVLCVIPARYASTRLPGKPLADIAGKPMIRHVYERACQACLVDEVVVATDDERVLAAVRAFGGNAALTSSKHVSGTDRLAEVAGLNPGAGIIINVQGDEPLIEPALIDKLAKAMLNDPALDMASAKAPMEPAEYDDPAAVKVVTDKDGYALYFSRSIIPYPRNKPVVLYKHIGIYAYRRDFLLTFAALAQSALEKAESLEQLRALENGYRVKVLTVDFAAKGVDTLEDLERVRKIIKKQEKI